MGWGKFRVCGGRFLGGGVENGRAGFLEFMPEKFGNTE
jgi:hypothetical protein